MSTNKLESETHLTVRGIPVRVVRKSIKNLHLGVYPPDGRVRVAAPFHYSDDNIRLAVASRLSWIKKQQTQFAAQPRQSKRELVSGETHYVFGRSYSLQVIERRGGNGAAIGNRDSLQLFVNPNTSTEKRARVLEKWYRGLLKTEIPKLLEKWQPIIGEEVREWGVKKMRTKWGSCNIGDRRIWLNLELGKKPIECLEYVLVHEMVHFLDPHHGDRFQRYMDKYLPQWRKRRDILNREPLADW